LLTFFAAAKKVSAAPHRGEANRPLRKQGEANAVGKQPKQGAAGKTTRPTRKQEKANAVGKKPKTVSQTNKKNASFEFRVGVLPGQARAQARRSERLTRVGEVS
jgi:hypothetical protein